MLLWHAFDQFGNADKNVYVDQEMVTEIQISS